MKKKLAEVKNQKGIFQEDALSPLLFVLAMMPLNLILKKDTGEYEHKLIKSQEKINHVIKLIELPRKIKNARKKANLQVLRNIGSGHHQTSGDEREN